ncbi:hypothetical protein BMR08_11615 [Methylococcaceae bacterium CS2]|nr:hypothetical protein BMR10_10550 [Methylococcaceae bacterium CS4]TXL05177.1 hypothetical protein BMR09_10605 [Methylococcaceae bacterium CS3]TXL09941.1 hypothetical protein BMR08_11615 [Methylococcaceae bacterium CS2]
MNVIIKIVQMTVVFIAMNGTACVARPINDIDNRTPNNGTASCKIAPGQNACYKFMFDPSIELPATTDTSGFNRIAVNLKPENKPESITYTVIEHHGGAFQRHGVLQNIGVKSASVGLSRVGHNESLKIVDGETSNEHARVNLLIQQARHATSQHSGTPVTNIHSPTQRMGDALVALRPSQLRTKPCSVKTTSNGWTAIRNAILASLARY